MDVRILKDSFAVVERRAEHAVKFFNWPEQDVFLSGPPAFIDEIAEVLVEVGASGSRIFHDAVPGTGQPRPLGADEWFLNHPGTHWHNPSGRAPRDY
ncbi:hypothetical protein NLX86_21440 [Streptomyces sp. A3M-1-3]|uniref:hypothetical protein n=1 Tax=Streptomyces sp. A3M-1-3 TaxID=2962044 RepID=UPI0020B79B24|nr:hypothetical protein [Streptomyces sp. A3M-1-3]MCP3820564.1 hypothetical protein [Streptomyces sp. A3M-1-3]